MEDNKSTNVKKTVKSGITFGSALAMVISYTYMVNNSSSRKRYASPKAGTELYLDLVFRQ